MTEEQKKLAKELMDVVYRGRYTYEDTITIMSGLANMYRKDCTKRAMRRAVYQDVYDIQENRKG